MVGMCGRGWLGSIERRVRHEIKVHARENAAIRRARYSGLQQLLRMAIAGRTLTWFLTAYLFVDVAAVVAEAFFYSSIHRGLPGWTAPELKGLLKDAASYFIAAQAAILGIVAVAVGILPLISKPKTALRPYYPHTLPQSTPPTPPLLLPPLSFP